MIQQPTGSPKIQHAGSHVEERPSVIGRLEAGQIGMPLQDLYRLVLVTVLKGVVNMGRDLNRRRLPRRLPPLLVADDLRDLVITAFDRDVDRSRRLSKGVGSAAADQRIRTARH